MKTWYTLLLLAIHSFAFSQSKNTEWKLKKEVDDLQIFVRKSATSDIKEIKVRYLANASLSNIVAVLKDVAAFPEWIFNCTEARVLERLSDTETIYYSRIAFPFPMNDRDFVAHSKLWQDAVTKEVFAKVTGDYHYMPIQAKVIRLPKLLINWHITPLTSTQTRIEYHLVSDPGGGIPDWAVNMAIDKGPINSMKNFKSMLSKSKYRNAKLAYIQELTEKKGIEMTK